MFASQTLMHSQKNSAAGSVSTRRTNTGKVVIQTERRLERVPFSVLELHTAAASEQRSSAMWDPVEVYPPEPIVVYPPVVRDPIEVYHSVEREPIEIHVEVIAENPETVPKRHPTTERDPIEVNVDLTAKEQSVAGLVLLEQACKVQHLGQTYYSCPICRQVYVLLSDVTTHLLSHSPEDVRAFQSSGHVDVKEEVTPQKKSGNNTYYTCQICNNMFVSLSDVQIHSRMHLTGGASVSTAQKKQAQSTIVENTEEASGSQLRGKVGYSCMSCPQKFFSIAEWKQHALVHFSGQTPGLAGQKLGLAGQKLGLAGQTPGLAGQKLGLAARNYGSRVAGTNVVAASEPRTIADTLTEESSQFNYRGETYYSCPQCPKVCSSFAAVQKHALTHVRVAAKTVVQTLRPIPTPSAGITAPPQDKSASVNTSAATAQPVVVPSQQSIPITQFTEEACQFVNGGKTYYSCLVCPKVYATFAEVRKHALTHVVVGARVAAKTVVQTLRPIPTPSAGITAPPQDKSASVNTSAATAQPVVVPSQQSISITEFTEEACQFVNAGNTYYSCLACPKVYATFAEVRKHAIYHVAGRKKYNCQICLEGFDSHQHFKVHKFKHVPAEEPNCGVCEKGLDHHKPAKNPARKYECPTCKESFAVYHQLTRHKLKHVTELRFKCVICDKAFKVNTQLTEHIKTHSTNKKYQCDLCEYKARTPFRIEHHKEDVHATGPGSIAVTCETCGKGFPSERRLKSHRVMHGERNFKCPDCDKTFYSRNNMRSHQEVHNPSKDNVCSCEICGQAFTHLRRLRSHIFRRHSDKNRHTCEFCSKVLSTRGSLTVHRRTHTGEKPFSCDVCGKKFNSKKYLVIHTRVHTGEKPFKCSQCEKAFSQRSTLIIHRRYHTGIRPYACEVCPRSFVTKTLLTTHEKTHPL